LNVIGALMCFAAPRRRLDKHERGI
jgi:hypothetical protein